MWHHFQFNAPFPVLRQHPAVSSLYVVRALPVNFNPVPCRQHILHTSPHGHLAEVCCIPSPPKQVLPFVPFTKHLLRFARYKKTSAYLLCNFPEKTLLSLKKPLVAATCSLRFHRVKLYCNMSYSTVITVGEPIRQWLAAPLASFSWAELSVTPPPRRKLLSTGT